MTTASPVAADLSAPLSLVLMRSALRVLSRTLPNVASRIAVDLFMTPRRFKTPERERALLADASPFDVRLGTDTTLRAWSWGEGPVVILVHGWEGRGSQMSTFVRPFVDAGYRVVTFDAPGHGASDGKRSSLPHFTWALRGVAAATAEPHAIIAHSLGCAATTLALREGLTANRLVFFAPPLEPVDYTARFADIIGINDNVLTRMRLRIEERFLRRWSDYSLAQTAKEMTAPLLVIHDREDRETYWSEGHALAAAWPNARLITTEGLGHRRVLRDASLIEQATRFISDSRICSPATARGATAASE
jgi:pimeloyl-ACP methyl ester carboxylesterase